MNRLFAITLAGAAVLTHSNSTDAAMAQMSGAANMMWLSCTYNVYGQTDDKGNLLSSNYLFVIDLKNKRAAQYEKYLNEFYARDDVHLSQNSISFLYYTRGSHPHRLGEELLHSISRNMLNDPLKTYVSTSIQINVSSLAMREIRRYYDTMIDYGDGTCSVIQQPTPPSPQVLYTPSRDYALRER